MHLIGSASRREFLKRATALSTLGGATPFALNLASIGSAAAQTASDYKAIVCLFMAGGNDHNNTVIPFDAASHADYAAARAGTTSAGGLGLELNTLQEIVPDTSQGAGRQFALSAALTPIQRLFAQGKAAVVANVGPLIVPISTATQFRNGTVKSPPKLFSHNDQTSTWQAFAPEGVKLGWGGRLGDMFKSQNANSLFTAISTTGNAVFLSGQQIFQYQVSSGGATTSGGATKINGITGTTLYESPTGDDVLRSFITQRGGSNILEWDHADVTSRAVMAADSVTNSMPSAQANTAPFLLPTTLQGRNLARQLRTVGQLIAARTTTLNSATGRQVFFVQIGGFDTHDNQIAGQATLHADVANAVDYFYNLTVALGVADKVTLFTASDFGRTLASNGKGSDHAWGAHHFVVGGAVKGRNIYGAFPEVRLHTTARPNVLDVGSGRFIPTTSVDQYAATLSKWFGVPDSSMNMIVPNIGNFTTRDLGFMV